MKHILLMIAFLGLSYSTASAHGNYYDASNNPVPALFSGTDGMAWAWSASDGAWWPVEAATGAPGAVGTREQQGLGGSVFYWANDTCVGAPVYMWQADNRVVHVPHLSAYFRQGTVTESFSCWRWEGDGGCQFWGFCSSGMFQSIEATSPPVFDNAPYLLRD